MNTNVRLSLAAMALLMTGCASFTPGQSTEKDVLASWGKPVEERTLPAGGKILEYPREPLGFQNWRVTVDAGGVVRSVEQLIDDAHFERIRQGMTRQEVEAVLGRYSETQAYPNLNELVVSWSYIEIGDRHMFFNAHLDPSTNRVKYTSRTVDPIWQSIVSSPDMGN